MHNWQVLDFFLKNIYDITDKTVFLLKRFGSFTKIPPTTKKNYPLSKDNSTVNRSNFQYERTTRMTY